MKIDGKILISKVESNMEEDYVSITVYDHANGRPIMKIDLTLEQFGSVLAGNSAVECDLDIINLDTDTLGKKREVTTIPLECAVNYSVGFDEDDIAIEAKEYLDREGLSEDGWKYIKQPLNLNRFNRSNGTYLISIERYLEVTE